VNASFEFVIGASTGFGLRGPRMSNVSDGCAVNLRNLETLGSGGMANIGGSRGGTFSITRLKC
jgi:hypothetical protein